MIEPLVTTATLLGSGFAVTAVGLVVRPAPSGPWPQDRPAGTRTHRRPAAHRRRGEAVGTYADVSHRDEARIRRRLRVLP